jgi:hypothetical protein
VHWWIIKPEVDTNSGHHTPGGHVAAVFQDELYELVFGPAGYARLQSFGVVFGGNRVVIYLEPDSRGGRVVTANTARTQLLIANEGLDWAGYATEFRELMPEELRDYQDEIGSGANHTDHRKAIRERLNSVRELYRFGRYRPTPRGAFNAVPGENAGGEPRESDERPRRERSSSGQRGGSRGDIYSLFAQEIGVPAEPVDMPTEPERKWLIVGDGSRLPGDLEDRAARFWPEQNLLLINGDFRAFTDMVDRWVDRYSNVPGCRGVIEEVAREWFEQQLVETVMSALALKQSGTKWSMEELALLWNETALTAAVLPRYHVDMSIKRVLGQRLGRVAGVSNA